MPKLAIDVINPGRVTQNRLSGNRTRLVQAVFAGTSIRDRSFSGVPRWLGRTESFQATNTENQQTIQSGRAKPVVADETMKPFHWIPDRYRPNDPTFECCSAGKSVPCS